MFLEILGDLSDIFEVSMNYNKARSVANQKLFILGYIYHICNIIELYFSCNIRIEGALMVT